MTTTANLYISARALEEIWNHLHPDDPESEEAAFIFARHENEGDCTKFRCIEWYLVPPEGFLIRSRYHIELTDETRARVIKRAHDLGACLVEFHSHLGSTLARFSSSDLAGFREFIPHVMWRLKHRPYLALVASKSSFDALVWLAAPSSPQRLDGLIVDETLLKPTNLSPL